MNQKRPSSATLDRDQVILARLARLENKVDSIEQTTAFALRADYDRHAESVRTIFKDGKRRAQVYLAANGHRTVQEIAAHLRMHAPHVSRELKYLHSDGVLEVVDTNGASKIWGKKAIDRTLRITHFLRKEYQLTEDGLPVPVPKRRARSKSARAKR